MPATGSKAMLVGNGNTRYTARGMATERMRCYFDILIGGKVRRDPEGIEVTDLTDAVLQAQSAIEEMKQDEDLTARFGKGASLVVRIRLESVYCTIALDK